MPLILVSCVVSKRKYEELDYAKRKSDAQVRKLGKDNTSLDSKLKQTLAEYNDMIEWLVLLNKNPQLNT